MHKCPYATVMRPSNVHGRGDDFLWHYLNSSRRPARNISLWKAGLDVYKAPVFVSLVTF